MVANSLILTSLICIQIKTLNDTVQKPIAYPVYTSAGWCDSIFRRAHPTMPERIKMPDTGAMRVGLNRHAKMVINAVMPPMPTMWMLTFQNRVMANEMTTDMMVKNMNELMNRGMMGTLLRIQ